MPHETRNFPLCRDCRHLVISPYAPLCNHPEAPINVVDGAAERCSIAREGDGLLPGSPCGIEGLLFESGAADGQCHACGGTGSVRAPYSRDLTNCPDCRNAPISSASVATVESENPAGNKA